MPAPVGGPSYGLAPPVPPSAINPSSAAIGQPLQGFKQQGMGVGTTAGDFELFGPTMTAPKPIPNASTRQQQQQQRIPIPSSGSSSEASSMGDGDYPPVPELVADSDAPSPRSFSPPSPKFTVSPVRPGLLPHPNRAAAAGSSSSYRSSTSSSYRGSNNGSYRSERASSVPAPECPRPMRRKTQESRDWPSFYSSASSSSSSSVSSLTGAPTPQLGESKPLLVVDEPASFVTPTAASAASANPFDVSSFALSPAQPFYSAFSPPYTDHPLLPSEQSDLLDRVRRDLLDVDLSSIKGPLRALALSSSGGGVMPDYDRETTPTQQLFSPPRNHLLRSPATTASDATVSPQEAFLDYDQVDSRLHGSSSLFASMAPEINTPALSQSTAQLTLSPPGTAPPPVVSAAPTSPRLSTHASTHHHPRRPHPFSVPQNAVTWAEKRSKSGHRVVGSVLVGGDAADNDGDFAGEDDVEEEEEDENDSSDSPVKEEVVPVTRPGFAAPRPAVASDEVPFKSKSEDTAREDVKPFLVGSTPLPPTTMSFNPLLPLEAVTSSIRGGFPGFAPPPPPVTMSAAPLSSASASAPGSGSASAGQSAFQQELARQRGTASPATSATGTGTATPRRAAAATALTGLHGIAAMYDGSAASASSDAGLDVPARRPQRNRKRSRIAMSEEDDYDDDVATAPAQQPRPGFAAAPPPPPPPAAALVTTTQNSSARTSPEPDPESDASYHSSGSSFGGSRRQTGASAPPNKRRRRAQGSASGATGSGSIVCNHLNSDGSTCGVIFRRPYDLARHKETIHGEGLKGEKVKAKEWKCAECGGTFSRKDALLRHGRIRGHSTG